MSKILINNGRVIDPSTGRDEVVDVFIVDGNIDSVAAKIEPDADTEVIEAEGKLVIPGVIDLHVHLRDLEQAYKETIETGTKAALKGGVTTVVTMPNTKPPLDCEGAILKYKKIIEETAAMDVHIAGAITKGQKGEELAELDKYPDLGIRFVTDDGFDVEDEALLEKAYKAADDLGLTLMTHPEMHKIAPDGVVNEGMVSKKLNIPGQPNKKEWQAIERGVKIALKLGTRAHFTHISTYDSVQLLRDAKKQSHLITCDATPHHFSLTEDEVLKQGGLAKVNPPLRTEEDRLALIEGLKDGAIDAIVTDHAPHSMDEKTDDLITSAFGISGLEILVPATITELHFNQGIDLMKVVSLMTLNPAQLAGFNSGRIQAGHPANITIIDLYTEKEVDPSTFVSKGKNTPFKGKKLKGWPVITIYKGKVYKH